MKSVLVAYNAIVRFGNLFLAGIYIIEHHHKFFVDDVSKTVHEDIHGLKLLEKIDEEELS